MPFPPPPRPPSASTCVSRPAARPRARPRHAARNRCRAAAPDAGGNAATPRLPSRWTRPARPRSGRSRFERSSGGSGARSARSTPPTSRSCASTGPSHSARTSLAGPEAPRPVLRVRTGLPGANCSPRSTATGTSRSSRRLKALLRQSPTSRRSKRSTLRSINSCAKPSAPSASRCARTTSCTWCGSRPSARAMRPSPWPGRRTSRRRSPSRTSAASTRTPPWRQERLRTRGPNARRRGGRRPAARRERERARGRGSRGAWAAGRCEPLGTDGGGSRAEPEGLIVRDGRVVVVHRPKYDDCSFPKGKAGPGETDEDRALREVRRRRPACSLPLGEELPTTVYRDDRGTTEARFAGGRWGRARASSTPTDEVDRARGSCRAEAREHPHLRARRCELRRGPARPGGARGGQPERAPSRIPLGDGVNATSSSRPPRPRSVRRRGGCARGAGWRPRAFSHSAVGGAARISTTSLEFVGVVLGADYSRDCTGAAPGRERDLGPRRPRSSASPRGRPRARARSRSRRRRIAW